MPLDGYFFILDSSKLNPYNLKLCGIDKFVSASFLGFVKRKSYGI